MNWVSHCGNDRPANRINDIAKTRVSNQDRAHKIGYRQREILFPQEL